MPAMERPQKRLRSGQSPFDDDSDDDELGLDPAEFEAKQNPGYKLEKSRAQAAFKLKSTFEHIFEKYEKDFTGVGDEIDLRTGEIVVDNGHLQSMEDEQDIGAPSVADSTEEEDRILHGRREAADTISTAGPMALGTSHSLQRPMSLLLGGGASRLSQVLLPSRFQLTAQSMPFGSFGLSSRFADPAWRVPDIPVPAFGHGSGLSWGSGLANGVPVRTTTRKLLAPAMDRDEEDDILLGTTNVNRGESLGGNRQIVLKKPETPPSDVNKSNRKPNQSPPEIPAGKQRLVIQSHSSGRRRGMKTLPNPGPKGRDPKSWKARTSGSLLREKPVVVIQEFPRKQRSSRRAPTDFDGLDKENTLVVVAKKRRRRTATLLLQDSAVLPNLSATQEGDQTEFYEDTRWWTTKPTNQIFQVEIPSRTVSFKDDSETQVVPRPSTPDIRSPVDPSELEPQLVDEGCALSEPAATPIRVPIIIPDSQNPSPTLTSSPFAKAKRNRVLLAPGETYSRNILDPAYNFSDEEEGGGCLRVRGRHDASGLGKKLATIFGAGNRATRRGSAGETGTRSTAPSSANRPRIVDHNFDEDDNANSAQANTLGKDGRAVKPAESTSERQRKRRTTIIPDSPAQVTVPVPAPVARKGTLHEKLLVGGQATPPATPKNESEKKAPEVGSAPLPTKAAITSLVSDDEDELSLGHDNFARPGRHSLPFLARRDALLSSGSARTTTTMKRRLVAARADANMPVLQSRASRASLGNGSDGTGKRESRQLARTPASRAKVPFHDSASRRHSGGGLRPGGGRAPSPAGSPVRTPGGTMRRCGEDGFRCDRDFCFTCL